MTTCKHNWVSAQFFLTATNHAYDGPDCTECSEDASEVVKLIDTEQPMKARAKICEVFLPEEGDMRKAYESLGFLQDLEWGFALGVHRMRDSLDGRLRKALDAKLEPEIASLVWALL